MYREITVLGFYLLFCLVPLVAQVDANRLAVESAIGFTVQDRNTLSHQLGFNSNLFHEYETRETNLITSIGIGYIFSKGHSLGLLFNYAKTEENTDSYFSELDTIQGTSSEYIEQHKALISSKSYGIYYRYFVPLGKNLVFSSRLSGHFLERYIEGEPFDRYEPPTNPFFREVYTQTFTQIDLDVLLSYHFNNWFAVQAKIASGAFQMRLTDTRYAPGERDLNNIKAGFDINPLHWEFGVLLILGKENNDKL